MTAEEVLEILSNNLYESKIIHEYKDGKFDYRKIVEWFLSQTPIMEAYAIEREQKYKELWEAQKEYINDTKDFCRHLLKPCSERDINWLVRKNLFDDDLNLSASKISALEQELGLTPAKV